MIYRYGPYEAGDEFSIEGIKKVIHFGYKSHQLYVWAETGDGTFHGVISGTGQSEPENHEHFMSVVSKGGFVWHLYLK